MCIFFFSSRRRHTRWPRDWSSDVCSSDIENRTHVSVDQISPNVLNALIATEDHRFFNHWGVDTQSLMRLPYYWIQQRFQGGSTISQQLARNLYRKIGFDVSITRKLREMITAVQIEHNYTKQEILEMYLNT